MRLFLTPFLLLLASTAWAGPEMRQLTVDATFSPPHNEPVIGDRVARYRLEAKADLKWGRVEWEPKLTAWGVNRWQPSDVVGHGIPEAWENSDWSIERFRYSMTQTLSLRLTEHFALTTE